MLARTLTWAVGLMLAGATLGPAWGQYTAVQLPVPYPFGSAAAYASSEGQQAGEFYYGHGHAALWNNVSGTVLDLDPGRHGSIILAEYLGYQGGENIVTIYTTGGSGRGGGGSRSYPIPHAVIWHGSAASMVDLNPAGAYRSAVAGFGSGGQVGWAAPPPYYSLPHAYFWKSSAASAVDLNPAGFTESWATGINGSDQVGYGVTSGGAEHALMWTGTAASAVDLHPSDPLALSSIATAVNASHNQQVGVVVVGTTTASAGHAYLWSGTPAGGVDLNPAGFASSEATATIGVYQAGFGAVLGQPNHALVWRGSAASAIDLHKFLPPAFTSSEAYAVDADGSVVGSAYYYNTTVPVIWRLTGKPGVVITQNPQPTAAGWCTAGVSVFITSPFSNAGSSITYRVNGGTAQTVAGSGATVPLASSGSYHVDAYASNGLGVTTATQGYTVNVDVTPPVTHLAFVRPAVTLTATDPNSGVLATYYKLDGGSTLVYSAPFAVENVAHTLEFWSCDRAGNIEAHHTVTLAAVAPTVTALTPNTDLSGSPAFTLLVTGTNFIASSTVLWNGSARPTTYLSATQLQAAIGAPDVAAPAVVPVSVTNPAPGTGTSGSVTFTVLQRATAVGPAANIQEASQTSFDISPATSHSGFTLSGTTVHVETNASTVFMDKYGSGMTSAVFFDTLTDGQVLSVVGAYDAATSTLTATTLQYQ